MRCEGRLRGLDEPAKAGFADQAPGTSVPRRATVHQLWANNGARAAPKTSLGSVL